MTTKAAEKLKILIVCNWPLGGIRTYIKYNYHYFPKDKFDITLLASPSIERKSLEDDMNADGIKVVWSKPVFGQNILFFRTAQLLIRNRYDLIHSQGFISGIHVSLINWIFRKPHILTMHGVPEEKRFRGRFGWLKRWIFERTLRNVSVIHGVGEDILNHVQSTVPKIAGEKTRWITIRNGVNPEPFIQDYPGAKEHLHELLEIPSNTFIFGYFGRFMPEKGFDVIIDAVSSIKRDHLRWDNFVIVAVGSGDYESKYKGDVNRGNLSNFFHFLPFNPRIAELIQGCDAILMPSIWEAYGLLSSETLCSGVPLIATDCIGLREAVQDTPAIQIPANNSQELAIAMIRVMSDPSLKNQFSAFRKEAENRFHVKYAAEKLIELIHDEVNREKV